MYRAPLFSFAEVNESSSTLGVVRSISLSPAYKRGALYANRCFCPTGVIPLGWDVMLVLHTHRSSYALYTYDCLSLGVLVCLMLSTTVTASTR